MVHKYSLWRISGLLLTLSVTYSMTSALGKQSRLLADSHKSFYPPIKESDVSKTDLNAGNAKSYGIDYSLYNYGGNAVLSLTKNGNPGFSWNDTQASTVAALGNAALLLGGAFLFNSITNRPNHYVNQRLYGAPLPVSLRPTPLRKRRLRKKGQKIRKRRLRQRRPVIGGRRRLRKNMNIRRRPGTFIHPAQPQYTNYLNNHRIKYEDDYFPPQTRDHIHISLEDELEPYTKEASVLEPIKPMMYDPYLYDENVPMTMDEYYYDYYDDMPDVSALRGPAPSFNDLATPDDNIPPMSAKKVFPPITRQPTSVPTLANKDPFKINRVPSRQETLLKMSEDKQREKLQKERAKLLEATFITPPAEKQIENFDRPPISPPETEEPKKDKLRTRLRVPIVRRRRKNNENRNEINSNDVKDDSSLTPFQTTFNTFSQPSLSYNPPSSSYNPPSSSYNPPSSSYNPPSSSYNPPSSAYNPPPTFQPPSSYNPPPSFNEFSKPPTFSGYSQPSSAIEENQDKIGEDLEEFAFRDDIDPFEEMQSDFDVTNDDWISTISQAFEGFSDFKKLRK